MTMNYNDFLMLIALGYTLLLCAYLRFCAITGPKGTGREPTETSRPANARWRPG
jgi:hypothetical protein